MSWRMQLISFIRENAKPVDKFDHQPRLYALTKEIGGNLTYDDDIVFAAVWLHDLGVFMGHRPEDPVALVRWDNVVYACEQAPKVLESVGFPQEKISAVVEAIRNHQHSAAPTDTEAIILRDADILEQLGAAGIVRALAKIGRDTRYPTHHEVLPILSAGVRELPRQLRLETSKRLAASKVEALHQFLSAWRSELGAE